MIPFVPPLFTIIFTTDPSSLSTVTIQNAWYVEFIDQIVIKNVWNDTTVPYRQALIRLREEAKKLGNMIVQFTDTIEGFKRNYGVDLTTFSTVAIPTGNRKKDGLCPKCGKDGNWIRMALVCPEHGVYAGC